MTEGSRRHQLLSLAGGATLATATLALFLVSRGKWSDALVDSGREWIVPDALARGELLYRDVVYWFGPFTPYFHAAFFRVLGSSFRTLVVAGVVGSLGVLVALYVALRTVTEKREATLWTALAVPALVFMPNAGGSILGMGYRMWHAAAFSLLAVAAVSRLRSRGPLVAAVSAGILSALAGLCRTEWGIAALLSCFLALGTRDRFDRVWLREAFVAGTAALLLFGGVLGLFILSAGAEAVLTDGPILLFGLPDETRSNVALAGLRAWRSGLVPLLYSSLMWIGVVLAVEVVVLRREDPKRAGRKVRLLLAVLVVLALLALVARGSGAVLFSAAPVVCLLTLWVGIRRRGSPEAAALAGFGLLGLLVSHRRFFHISDGPYVAPPLAIAFVSGAALLWLFVDRERDSNLRGRLQNGLLTVIGALACFAFAGRSFQYLSDGRVPIPGTQGMLSAREEMAGEIVGLASLIRRETRRNGLVVFPEGEILNYLSNVPNPIRHTLYLPGYVTDHNEEAIVRELDRARPAAIVLWNRPTGEYGRGGFGADYGLAIARWIEKNYAIRRFRVQGPLPPGAFSFRYGVWKTAAERQPE